MLPSLRRNLRRLLHQCDLKPLTLGVLYLEPTHLSLAWPQRQNTWLRGWGVRGAQAGGFSSIVFLGWTRPGVCGALPVSLSWSIGTGKVYMLARACGRVWALSLEKNSPFHSFLGVCGAISGGQMQQMLHHVRQSMKCSQERL